MRELIPEIHQIPQCKPIMGVGTDHEKELVAYVAAMLKLTTEPKLTPPSEYHRSEGIPINTTLVARSIVRGLLERLGMSWVSQYDRMPCICTDSIHWGRDCGSAEYQPKSGACPGYRALRALLAQTPEEET